MNWREKAAPLIGALSADSLSLGSHWVYNTRAIEKRLGTPDRLTAPIVQSFHPGKKAGEFTHYGDQVFWLLEELVSHGTYEPKHVFSAWMEKAAGYEGYQDHAMKEVLEQGRASDSDDLAGASRTPVLALIYQEEEKLVEKAREHSQLFYRNPAVADSAEFFARLLFTEGDMSDDIEQVLARGSWKSEGFSLLVKSGMDSAAEDTVSAIDHLGQSCSVEKALPSAVHLLCRYPESYKEAMVANCAAGGDSAARGILAGMVLASRLSPDAVPEEWIAGLKRYEELERAVEAVVST